MPTPGSIYVIDYLGQPLEELLARLADKTSIAVHDESSSVPDLRVEIDRPCCIIGKTESGLPDRRNLTVTIARCGDIIPPVLYWVPKTMGMDAAALMEHGAYAVLASDDSLRRVERAIRGALATDRRRYKEQRRLDYLRSLHRGLTRRELEVAELIVNGKSNQDVAQKCDVSIRTIETRRAKVFEKFGVQSIAQFAVLWSELSLREKWLHQHRSDPLLMWNDSPWADLITVEPLAD